MNFVFYSQIFLGRRSCYFMEGMGGIGVVWILTCALPTWVRGCQCSSVCLCDVYVRKYLWI